MLLLDDYHLIHDEQIHAAMAFFLEQLSGGHRVVLASRAQPPLPLARLRVQGALSEIDPGQLGFSESDAAGLLNGVHGLGLGEGAVRRLHWRTEGWAAGLYLAALSLRGRETADELIESFAGSDRRIVDYLGAEVLDQQPGEVLTFLLRTSVLERLCGSLCDAVTGRGGGQEMLERIERSNAFLVPLDARREWYRYHHVFAELLRHELGRREPESVAPLHRVAASWLLDAGLISEAVRQMVAAGDVDGAADVVVAHWVAFVNAGERAMVAEWLDAIPDERILTDGYLCVARAGLSAWTPRQAHTTRHAEILFWLDHAERAEVHSPADNRSVWLQATLLRAATWELRGDMGQTKQLAEQISPLDGSSPWHTFAAYLRGVSAGWLGNEADAAQMLSATARLGRQHMPVLAVIAYGQLALIAADLENWGECEATIDAAFALIDEADLDEYWMGALAHVANGRLLRHARRLREAEAELERAAVALGRRGVGVVELAYALLMLADVRRELGDNRSARELVVNARERIANAPDPGLPVTRLLQQAERNFRLAPHPGGLGSIAVEELTPREQEVLRLLPTGLSAREIGDELGVSRNTIKSHGWWSGR